MDEFIYEVEGIKVRIPKKSWEDSHGVSMCCIILNEEKGIHEFLSYHKPYFKEIIMVDLGSTDRTIEYAMPLADVIIHYKQDGHHSNALNRVMEKVSYDWTCLVDCDERMNKWFLEHLSDFIDQEEYDCYSVPRRNFIDGKPDPVLPMDYQDRLFRSYCRMVRPVHQELVGYKSKKILDDSDTMFMLHSKSGERHKIRNAGYQMYEYKFKHELGGPGSQLKESFNNGYPKLTWEEVYPDQAGGTVLG